MNQEEIFSLIRKERLHQDRKWGPQSHTDFVWSAILGEEVGEACKAILEHEYGGRSREDVRRELVQVAAVAVAWLEYNFN